MKICHPRVDKRLNWNAKEFVSAEEFHIAEQPYKKPNNQRKVQCKGPRCSNQPKKGCDFDMCGRCCKKVAEPCSVHEDAFSVFEPPTFQRNYNFFKIEPKAFFRFVENCFLIKKCLGHFTSGLCSLPEAGEKKRCDFCIKKGSFEEAGGLLYDGKTRIRNAVRNMPLLRARRSKVDVFAFLLENKVGSQLQRAYSVGHLRRHSLTKFYRLRG